MTLKHRIVNKYFKNTRVEQVFHNTLKYMLVAYIGAIIGIITSWMNVFCFGLMITSKFINVYYAAIFFIIGSHNVNKLMKKNRLITQQQDQQKEDESKQFFRRPPLIFESTTLYKQSLILNEKQNELVNRINFFLEVNLTLSVYLSSILVLTIEKDWWGGYLTNDESKNKMVSDFQDFLRNGKQVYKENPVYVLENTVRLIFIGCSITFCVLIMLIDTVQLIFSFVFLIYYNLTQCLSKLQGHESSEKMSKRQVIQNSRLIVSNVQMTLLLLATFQIGIGVAYIQGRMDPEGHGDFWGMLEGISREVVWSSFFGANIGSIMALAVIFILSYEQIPNKNQDDQKLKYDSLNFEDTEEYLSQRSSYNPHLNFENDSEILDDDEQVCLIDINYDLKLKEKEQQLLEIETENLEVNMTS